MANLTDDFKYILDIMQDAEEEIDAEAGDREYTEQQSELLYIIGEISNMAESGLRLSRN